MNGTPFHWIVSASVLCVLYGPATASCPELLRIPVGIPDRQLSMIGGVSGTGVHVADDFHLDHRIRQLSILRSFRVRMLANFQLTPENVRLDLMIERFETNGNWPDPTPGAVVATLPHWSIGAGAGASLVAGTVRIETLGPSGFFAADNRSLDLYDVTFSHPDLSAAGGWGAYSWYWASPYAIGASGSTDEAYVVRSESTNIHGQPAQSATSPFFVWQNVCCGPARDIAMEINFAASSEPVADINCDNVVNPQDIFDYLNFWFARDPRADIGNNGISVQDIYYFLNQWFDVAG